MGGGGPGLVFTEPYVNLDAPLPELSRLGIRGLLRTFTLCMRLHHIVVRRSDSGTFKL